MTARALRFLPFVCAFVVLAVAIGTAAAWADANGAWRTILGAPPGRIELTFFDAQDRKLCAFSSGNLDAFEVDGPGPWTRKAANGAFLGPRTGYALAYDASANRILLFGGKRPTGEFLADVWQLALDDPSLAWVEIAMNTPAIAPRHGTLMAFDPGGQRLIVYGGTIIHPTFGEVIANDVWVLDLSATLAWTELAPPTPSPLAFNASDPLRFDAARNRLVLLTSTCDVWAFPLVPASMWQKLNLSAGQPDARFEPSVILDPVGDRLVVFGGGGKVIPCCGQSGDTVYGDSWQFSFANDHWSTFGPAGPEPRQSAGAVYDAAGARMLIVGGTYVTRAGIRDYARDLCEVWQVSLGVSPAWSFFPENSAPAVASHGAWDAKRHQVVMPMKARPGIPAGVWTLSGDDRWRFTPTTGAAEGLHAMSYEPVDDAIVGLAGSSELWRLDLSTLTWSMTPVAGGKPGVGYSRNVTYDAPHRRFYAELETTDPIYSATYNGIFTFPLDGPYAWTEVPPTGAVPLAVSTTRWGLFSDVLRDRLVGIDLGAFDIDPWQPPLWTVLGTLWQSTPSQDDVEPDYITQVSYDARRDRQIFFSGVVPVGLLAPEYLLMSWELDGPLGLAALAAAGPLPAGRANQLQVADPWNDRLVIADGNHRYGFFSDTWVLEWSDPLQPKTTGGPDVVWTPGQSSLVDYTVTNASSTAGTLDYALESERNWPGYPITGQLALAGNATVPLELLAPVPDTVAAGANVLTLRIWETGAPALAQVLTRHLHDITTPTVLSFVDATYEDGAATITWWSPDGGSAHGTVERRVGDGGWTPVAELVADAGGRLVFVDRDLAPGTRYGYRLAWQDAHGATQWSESMAIDVPAGALAFGLLPPRSSPVVGALSVRFALAEAGVAALEVYDVRGRRVAHEMLADLDAGTYDRVPAGAESLRSGVYFVRLVQGLREARGRAVVLGGNP